MKGKARAKKLVGWRRGVQCGAALKKDGKARYRGLLMVSAWKENWNGCFHG